MQEDEVKYTCQIRETPLVDGESSYNAQVRKTKNGELIGSACSTFSNYPSAFGWVSRIRNGLLSPEWSCDKEGLIYLIIDQNGRTKIGKSDANNLKHRVSKHQCGNADELRIAAIWNCTNPIAKESEVHRSFMDRHVRGEWFAVDVEEVIAEFPEFELYIEDGSHM